MRLPFHLGNQTSPSRIIKLGALLLLIVLVLALVPSGSARSGTANDGIPEGYMSGVIKVRFVDGTDLDRGKSIFPRQLSASVVSMDKIFTLPEAKLNSMRLTANFNIVTGRSPNVSNLVPNLNMWYRLKLRAKTDTAAFLKVVERLPYVDVVEFAPIPAPPAATTPDFTGGQEYLDVAPGGVDARYAWNITGGTGSGVTIYDVEYGWTQTHEDLTTASGVSPLLDTGDSHDESYPDHGTAVLGITIGDNDSKGITGIAHDSSIGLAPAVTTNLGYDPANAISLAEADGSAGDIILLEQQVTACDDSLGPLEWLQDSFDAIQTAVGNGFVVVEAAGNGQVDLDQEDCDDKFDRGTRDSGAILVGSSNTPFTGTDRAISDHSSYGSRVDVHAWGEDIMSAGYGTFYTNVDDPTNEDFWYREDFGGTSGASAIVSGVVAVLQGISLVEDGSPMAPADIQTLLINTGSAQQGDTSMHIGPRPNLAAAIKQEFDILQAPVADANGPYSVDEKELFMLDGSGSTDPDNNIVSYEWDLDNDGFFDDATGVTPWHRFPDNGYYPIGLKVTDEYGESDETTTSATVSNVPPSLSQDVPNQTVQYSDLITTVTITGVDVPDDPMTASSSYSYNMGPSVAGLPAGLTLTSGPCVDNGMKSCTWTLDGNMGAPDGTYTIITTVEDGDGGSSSISTAIIVDPEDAIVLFDPANPAAVQVASPGGRSGPFSITLMVNETVPDGSAYGSAPGDIGNADVTVNLVPLGIGGAISPGSCSSSVSGSGYGAVNTFVCTFSNVQMNTYAIKVTVDGGYYAGRGQDVLTILDDSRRYVSGGGSFLWPGTGERTNFGFTLRYDPRTSRMRGNVMIMRHVGDGTFYIARGGPLFTGSIGRSFGPLFDWTTFRGLGAYLEPGWPAFEGNYHLNVYAEDYTKPGAGSDQFWMELIDEYGNVVVTISMPHEPEDNSVTIFSGDVAVPPR